MEASPTFILNEGYLGEMKGFANQKPASRFHPHIEELLGHDMVKGIRGGGFLPISNFSFMDFETSAQTRILEKRPDFEFDMIPSEGDSFLTFPGGAEWQKVEHHLMPDQAIRSVAGWYEDIPQWYVLRKYLEVGETRKHLSLGWCFIEKGKMSTIHLQGNQDIARESGALLRTPEVKTICEDILSEHSTWGKLLNTDQLEELIVAKPSLIGMAPLESVIEKFGVSQAFVEIFNARFGLEVTLSIIVFFYQTILPFWILPVLLALDR